MAHKLLDAAKAGWRCVNAPHLAALGRAGAPLALARGALKTDHGRAWIDAAREPDEPDRGRPADVGPRQWHHPVLARFRTCRSS